MLCGAGMRQETGLPHTVIIGSEFDINELANLLLDGDFGREPFHTAGSVEA